VILEDGLHVERRWRRYELLGEVGDGGMAQGSPRMDGGEEEERGAEGKLHGWSDDVRMRRGEMRCNGWVVIMMRSMAEIRRSGCSIEK